MTATILASLTPCEREVLTAILAGQSVPQIARLRGRSVYTIQQQRRTLRAKIGAKNSADIVRFALRVGLIAA